MWSVTWVKEEAQQGQGTTGWTGCLPRATGARWGLGSLFLLPKLSPAQKGRALPMPWVLKLGSCQGVKFKEVKDRQGQCNR